MPPAPALDRPPGPDNAYVEQVRRPEDVVDDLGLGLAQVWNLVLVAGIWLVDGMELIFVTVTTESTQSEFGLTASQAGSLTSCTFAGVLLGCLLSGWAGDRFGRRPPILIAYILVSAFGALTMLAASYGALLALRFVVGFGCGLGMPSSQAMISELSPSKWRMLMISGRSVFWCTGQLYATFILWIYDPHLAHVNWRACFAWGVLPAALLGSVAIVFLRESPVFLASCGDHAGAEAGFSTMRALNKRSGVGINYSRSGEGQPSTTAVPLWFHLCIIFGPMLLKATLAVLLANAVANLMMYGHSFGEPRVLIRADDNLAMTPAAQLFLDQVFAYVGTAVAAMLGTTLSRKVGLGFVMALSSLAFCGFATAVILSSFQHGWLLDTLLQVSLLGYRVVSKPVFLFAHQLSTEIYPTASRALGASMGIGVGRVGAILAPMIFVAFSPVLPFQVGFYYFAAALGAFTVLVVLAALPRDVDDLRDAASEDAAAAIPFKSHA